MSISKNPIKTRKSSTLVKFKNYIVQHSQHIFILVFIGISLYFTAISNDAYLKWAEEFSLFIPTIYYFGECMNSAGGLLAYAGTFLTQFFYFPILGSFIFIAILFLIQYLTVIAFCIPKRYYPLSFIPGLMLLLSITQLGYILLIFKSSGYFFSNSLGIVAFLLLFIAYRNHSNLILRIALLITILAVGYPLFGFYALFTGLFCLLYDFVLYVKDHKHSRLLPVIIGLALVASVPQFYYYFVYYHTQLCKIYLVGLPDFEYNLTELVLWLPFIVLFVSFPLFSYFLFSKHDDVKVRKSAFFASSAAFFSAVILLCVMSYSDANFTAGVRIYNAIERNDWEKVITVAKGLHGKPTKNIVLSYRMATLLTLKPSQDDPILNHENTIKPNCIRSTMPLKIQLGGISFYYNSGEVNKCYRWCMENTVEFGMRVSYLKYMVKCAIVNEEYDLARKYNAILLNSMFHKRWAQRYQNFIENPQLTKEDGEINIVRSMLDSNEQEFEQL
jgi:hypothetical protein